MSSLRSSAIPFGHRIHRVSEYPQGARERLDAVASPSKEELQGTSFLWALSADPRLP